MTFADEYNILGLVQPNDLLFLVVSQINLGFLLWIVLYLRLLIITTIFDGAGDGDIMICVYK